MKKIIKIFGSSKFGIYLIFIIAILVILGAIIPQVDSYKVLHSNLPDIIKKIFLFTGANDLYHSFIFLLPLLLFFINLFICTYNNFLVNLKISKKLIPENVDHFPLKLKLPVNPPMSPLIKGGEVKEDIKGGLWEDRLLDIIKKSGYKILSQKPFTYANKASWTRYGPLVTHISFFLLLIGVIIGVLYGFNTNISLVPPEEINMNNVVSVSSRKGYFVNKNYDWELKANKFWMEYRQDGSIKQYYSNLSIIKNKKEVFNKTIWVNEPLVYEGVYFYQASWGFYGIKVKIDKNIKDIEMNELSGHGYVSKILEIGGKKGVFYLENYQLYFIDKNFHPVADFALNKPVTVGSNTITYLEPLYLTTLQSKNDPGIPIVWISFFITMAGLIMVLWGHKQIGIVKDGDDFYLLGKTSKNIYSFENELNSIIEGLQEE